jgi:hypothetical protein
MIHSAPFYVRPRCFKHPELQLSQPGDAPSIEHASSMHGAASIAFAVSETLSGGRL